MKAADWIDRLKEAKGWDSDYRVAKELPLAPSTLSRYRNKPESTMDDDTAVKVADALRLDAEIVVLDQVTERTRSGPARAALSGLLRRIGGKVLAGAGGGSGAGKDPLDITSVTQSTGEGNLQVPRSKQYASCHLPAAPRRSPLSPLAQLARALLQLPAARPAAFA